jgi:hypothetical protein
MSLRAFVILGFDACVRGFQAASPPVMRPLPNSFRAKQQCTTQHLHHTISLRAAMHPCLIYNIDTRRKKTKQQEPGSQQGSQKRLRPVRTVLLHCVCAAPYPSALVPTGPTGPPAVCPAALLGRSAPAGSACFVALCPRPGFGPHSGAFWPFRPPRPPCHAQAKGKATSKQQETNITRGQRPRWAQQDPSGRPHQSSGPCLSVAVMHAGLGMHCATPSAR